MIIIIHPITLIILFLSRHLDHTQHQHSLRYRAYQSMLNGILVCLTLVSERNSDLPDYSVYILHHL